MPYSSNFTKRTSEGDLFWCLVEEDIGLIKLLVRAKVKDTDALSS